MIWIQVPNRSLASRLTVFIIMETSTDRFKSGRTRGSRFWEPYHSIQKLWFIEQINIYINNFGLGLEFTSLKVWKGFNNGKSKSFRLKNLHSSERKLDFLVWNWTSSKMTFTANIQTYKIIIEHNFDRNFGHVSKSWKLLCIFPFPFKLIQFISWSSR